jgi:hypothetical protein
MKQFTLSLSVFLLSLRLFACPDIEGNWVCYEKAFDYNYKENFRITKSDTSWSYLQTLTDDNGELPTFDKITDNIERVVSHIALGENEYFFRQNSFCPTANTLQTHEVVERHVKQELVGKSSAEFILRLEEDGSLSMITNSISEDGITYDNDFVGICRRAP